MTELEIVLENPDDTACLEAVSIARAAFARVTSAISVTDRPMDAGELESLQLASPSEPLLEYGFADPRIADLREFVTAQGVTRRRLGVPDSLKTMTIITSKSSAVAEERGLLRPLFGVIGYSIERVSEGVVAAQEITRSLVTPQQRKAAGLLIAFTLVHEAGHLFGQVPSGRSRSAEGGHCQKRCVMRTTPNNEETLRLTRKMKEDRGHRICFCSGCKEGIRSYARNSY